MDVGEDFDILKHHFLEEEWEDLTNLEKKRYWNQERNYLYQKRIGIVHLFYLFYYLYFKYLMLLIFKNISLKSKKLFK